MLEIVLPFFDFRPEIIYYNYNVTQMHKFYNVLDRNAHDLVWKFENFLYLLQVKTYLINSDGSDVIFHMIDNFLL